MSHTVSSGRHSGSPIIHLKVGGTVFRLTKANVDRFPNSLLANLLEACPKAIGSKEPLFIDRSPKGFEVILEIYR